MPDERLLDTSRAIETPEGVHIELRVAGPVVRFLAWAVDFFIRLVIYLILATVLPGMGRFGIGLFLVAVFLLEWFYPVLFEVRYHGATPGKRMLGIRVLQDNGIPVGWSASIIRNLLRFVDFLPVAYGFGVIAVLVNKDFKRLGDLAAGTVVVYGDAPRKAVPVPAASPVPPPRALTLGEQRAVISFAERAQGLTPERAEELADIAFPLTRARGEAGIQRLYQIANWLQGQR